jgi:chemotaxis protein histidine kinase CheA
MSIDIKSQLQNGKAYALFVSELDKHITEAILKTNTQGQAVITDNECNALRSTFHTIKGGAGFFGLNDIANVASNLENLFEMAMKDLNGQVSAIEAQLKEISKLAKQVPLPKLDSSET